MLRVLGSNSSACHVRALSQYMTSKLPSCLVCRRFDHTNLSNADKAGPAIAAATVCQAVNDHSMITRCIAVVL